MNLTNGNVEMREFLKGCVSINNKSYTQSTGLDVSSPDNCVTFTKDTIPKDDKKRLPSSCSNGNLTNNTSVWHSCVESETETLQNAVFVDAKLNRTPEKSLPSSLISDDLLCTPRSSISSQEYQQRLLFSTKPKRYFNEQNQQDNIENKEEQKELIILENNNNVTNESNNFTFSDSTVPIEDSKIDQTQENEDFTTQNKAENLSQSNAKSNLLQTDIKNTNSSNSSPSSQEYQSCESNDTSLTWPVVDMSQNTSIKAKCEVLRQLEWSKISGAYV